MPDPYRMIVVNGILSLLLICAVLFFKLIYPKRSIHPFILLLLISLLPITSIFRPGTYESGDLTLHSVFLQSFIENIKDGILIPQWAGGLCGGYGCPIFLFEYTLPFFIGTFFHLLGFSYIDSIKLFLALAYIASGITMYIFVRSELSKTAAFVAAVLYLFAPFHLMETHFRVGIGNVASFVFVPLSFLFAKKSLEGKIHYIVLGAFNFFFLLLSHANVAFIVFLTSLVYAFVKKKNISQMIFPILSSVLGIGISSYYLLPAIFEIKYTEFTVSIYTVDFKPFFDYIYSPTRFGLLFQGNNGEGRFIVGYTQLFVALYGLYAVITKKIEEKYKATVIFLLASFFIYFTLLQSFTKFIWDSVFFLRSFQFPWRLLTPIAFITAYLGAYVTRRWKTQSIVILCGITIFVTILNWGNRKMVTPDPEAYVKHESMYTEYYNPENPFYRQRLHERAEKNITLAQLISNRPPYNMQILQGNGQIKEVSRTQVYHEYVVYGETNLELSENTFYFPGWKIYVDHQEIPINIMRKDHFGALTFKLPKGLHHVVASFEDTPLRTYSKYISASFISMSLLLLLVSFRNNEFPVIKSRKSKLVKRKTH